MNKYFNKFRENRKFAFISTLKSTFVTLVLFAIVYYIGNNFLPIAIFEYFGKLIWLLGLYLIYSFYITYSDLTEYLDQSDHIQSVKERWKYPIAGFKDSIGRAEVFLELHNKKLEIVKFISPVPVILYFWGLAMKEDLHLLTEKLTYFDYSINYRDFFIYSAYVLFVVYIVLIRHYLHAYKKQYLKLERLKSELETYEEILFSIKETRRVEYKDTIETILRK